MLLTPFATLLAVGFGAWLCGHYFDYTGVASVGAVLIIAVGGTVAFTGLDAQNGERVERDYAEVNNSTVVDNTTVSYQYSTVSVVGGPLGELSVGGLMMLIGGLLWIQHLNEVALT